MHLVDKKKTGCLPMTNDEGMGETNEKIDKLKASCPDGKCSSQAAH